MSIDQCDLAARESRQGSDVANFVFSSDFSR
jgi:hypothetical protein